VQYIKRIRFTAAAVGDCGTGLHDQRLMSLDSISLGRVAGVTPVKVSRKNNVYPALGKSPHCAFGAANQVPLRMVDGKIKGMMANDDFRNRSGKMPEFFAHQHDVFFPEPPMFGGERARAVQPKDRHFIVNVAWQQIIRHVPPVPF
jgi:hypothetical protein